jgi:hypothetical protein
MNIGSGYARDDTGTGIARQVYGPLPSCPLESRVSVISTTRSSAIPVKAGGQEKSLVVMGSSCSNDYKRLHCGLIIFLLNAVDEAR